MACFRFRGPARRGLIIRDRCAGLRPACFQGHRHFEHFGTPPRVASWTSEAFLQTAPARGWPLTRLVRRWGPRTPAAAWTVRFVTQMVWEWSTLVHSLDNRCWLPLR